MLKISVIIPSFNSGKFISKAIDSVLFQTYPNKEIIVLDNCSTDETSEVCQRYGDKVKFICAADDGQYDAINKGLHMCTGDIFTYLNCDDFYNCDMFTDIAKKFEDPRVTLVYGNCIVEDGETTFVQKPAPHVTKLKLLQYGNLLFQPASFFRKETLLAVGGTKKCHYMMEYDMFLKVLDPGIAAYLDKDISTFVMHPGQKSASQNQRKIADELIDIMLSHGGSKTYPSYIGYVLSSIIPYRFISLIKSALIKLVP